MSTSIDRGHVWTMGNSALSTGRRRRTYSPEFKAKAVAACSQPGVSLAAIAMDLRVNDNILRRWVRETERAALLGSPATRMELAPPPSGLVPITVASASVPAPVNTSLRITVQHRGTTIEIVCPPMAEAQCAALLSELLR